MDFSAQGVLELEEGGRSNGEGGQGEYVWLQEVQDQIRNGALSEDNWFFCTVAQCAYRVHGQEAPRSVEIVPASLWRRLEQPVALILEPS